MVAEKSTGHEVNIWTVLSRSVQVAETALAIPVSNAWPERGASQLKLITSTTELQHIREEYEEALHVLHLDDMVEEELDSLEAFAKSMETDDSGDSGVDE